MNNRRWIIYWNKVANLQEIKLCPKCSRVMLLDEMRDGTIFHSCVVCDAPYYYNHCWKCNRDGITSIIDSRLCDKSPVRQDGYICNVCGYDLKRKRVFPVMSMHHQPINVYNLNHIPTI
jgi:hypothetical protein